MFERTKAFASNIINAFAPAVRDKPLEAKRKQLQEMMAYVDPTKLFHGGKLSMPYNPSVLVTRKGLDVFDRMKQDEQVKYALQFKKDTLLSSGWEIEAPQDQADDWEVAEFCRYALERIEDGFNKSLGKMMLSMDYGYSLSEKVFGPDDLGEWQGKLLLKRLVSVKPHYFDFNCDEHGTLMSLVQKYVPGEKQQLEFAPGKFVICVHQKEFENFYGRSDLEAAYRAWWVKDNTYKWFAVMLERYGMPPLFMLYNASAYQGGQLDELKKVIRNIQNATMGMIPRQAETDLELWTPQLAAQAKSVFLEALARFDQDIARALLVPGLIGATPDENTGSLARSEQHFEGFMGVVRREQDDLALAVNSQIIRPLCDLNFPSLKSYPKFKFLPFEDKHLMERMTTWSALVAGKVVNRIEDDEGHIRAALDFPENPDPVIEELPADELARAKAETALNPPSDPDLKDKLGAQKQIAAMRKPVAKPKPKVKKNAEVVDAEFFEEEESLAELAEAEGEIIELSDQTEAMIAFAAEQDCVWRTVRGRAVCIRPKATTEERVRRALLTHKPSTVEKQRLARENELLIAKLLGGRSTGDNEPMDLTLRAGSRAHGVEVKTFIDNSNDKLTMHPDALSRKLKWARREKAQLHTVVVDARNGTNEIYYRKGVGSFRLHTMTKVDNARHLSSLITGRSPEARFDALDEARLFEYNPSQPRAPKGSDDGGQWIKQLPPSNNPAYRVADEGVPPEIVNEIELLSRGLLDGVSDEEEAGDLVTALSKTHREDMLRLIDGKAEDKRAFTLLHRGDEEKGIPTVWLLGWSKQEGTDLHDHGASEVGVHVLRGKIVERSYSVDAAGMDMRTASKTAEGMRVLSNERRFRDGSTMTIRNPYIHDVFGTSDRPHQDVTVHAYWPPLREMGYYKFVGKDRLRYDGQWKEGEVDPDAARRHSHDERFCCAFIRNYWDPSVPK